jgi:putative peptidoglycan lipid II flippase
LSENPQPEILNPKSELSRAVRATSLVTLGSRFGGLIRDVVIGRIFPVGYISSAFQAAFAIPNMFRRLFGEGALSAAFIPEYSDAARASRQDADRLASLTITALGLITTALTVLIEAVLLLVLLLKPRADDDLAYLKFALSIKLIMVMIPFMPLICTVAIQAGMLQVHGRYGPAASGPIILNTFVVATGAYFMLTHQFAGQSLAYILGAATVLSGLTQCLWFASLLRRHFSFTRAWSAARPRARSMLRKFIPVAVGLGTLQLNTFLDTLIAMWPIWIGPTMLGLAYPLDESSNVLLALTARLYQFPLGVFGIAIASAAFPLLARHAREPDHFTETLRRAVRLSLYVGFPATLGLILLRTEAVSLLYGHGHTGWSEPSIRRASHILGAFSTGIWAYSLNQVFTRTFYAQGDTATPMKVSLLMIVLNVALNLSLIWIPNVREAGLAWSTAISAILQSIILGTLCARMLRRLGAHHRVLDHHARVAIAKSLLATALMGAAVWLLLRLYPSPPTWAMQLVRTLLAIGLGGIVYLALSQALRLAELKWLLHRHHSTP